MKTGGFINGWTIIALILVIIIVASGIFIWSRYNWDRAIEIYTIPDRELRGEIYISGAVGNPGCYPLGAGDSMEEVLRAAGGTTDNADLYQLQLYVPDSADRDLPQKVNINRAEAWLLEALPGVGEVKAQAIIEYRQQKGPFRNINELVEVEGFGYTSYENIKHLITVSD